MQNYQTISLHWVNRLSFLNRKYLTAKFNKNGHEISPEEWAVLLILAKNEIQTPSALSDVTFRDRTTVTRLIDGMVKKNLVFRTEDPKDRRRSLLHVSDIGKTMLGQLIPLAQEMIDDALDGISPEDIETTTKTLRKMTQNLLFAKGASK